MQKTKWVIIIEFFIILLLLFLTLHNKQPEKQTLLREGLLSPRIYAGILQPKSYLITNFNPLKDQLQNHIDENNLNVSVYLTNLRDGSSMGINANEEFYPLSLNKVPIAILILKRVEDGELSLDQEIYVSDKDKSDTFGDLYKYDGFIPLKVLLDKMLVKSDNTAAKVLLRYIDERDLRLFLEYYDIDLTVYYPILLQNNHSNLLTPKSMSTVFTSLYLSTVLEANDSEYILKSLTHTVFDINKVANLPENITVSQKFGENYLHDNKYFHDCGIIYIDQTRISYCVMTEGMEQDKAVDTIGYVVHDIYDYVITTRRKLSLYREDS